MSPRSPQFKSILYKAFSSGALVGVTVQARRGPSRWPSIRFYFRHELNQLTFAARLEELGPTFARDHSLGHAIGQRSGTLFFVELPLSSVRTVAGVHWAHHPLALPVVGGVRGLPPVLVQLSAL